MVTEQVTELVTEIIEPVTEIVMVTQINEVTEQILVNQMDEVKAIETGIILSIADKIFLFYFEMNSFSGFKNQEPLYISKFDSCCLFYH